jgi:transcriptional regulator with XRE-family HTH domain
MTTQPLIYLRQWRQWRALSQTELMKLAGVTHATISRLENRHYGATPTVRRKLAKALDIEPHELLTLPPGMDSQESAKE